MFFRTVILGSHDRGSRCPAVTKGVGKAFYPGGGSVGSNGIQSTGIDSTLYQKLSDVKTGLVQGSYTSEKEKRECDRKIGEKYEKSIKSMKKVDTRFKKRGEVL